jgi:hypothetical protein
VDISCEIPFVCEALEPVKSIASRLYPDSILACDRGAMRGALYLPEWMPMAEHAARQLRATTAGTRGTHHALYVVLLEDTRRVGRWGLYVGETTLDPDLRFDQHKTGYKASRHVNRFGVRLLPQLFEHFNPLRRWEAVELEPALAEAFRHAGVPWVEGGH